MIFIKHLKAHNISSRRVLALDLHKSRLKEDKTNLYHLNADPFQVFLGNDILTASLVPRILRICDNPLVNIWWHIYLFLFLFFSGRNAKSNAAIEDFQLIMQTECVNRRKKFERNELVGYAPLEKPVRLFWTVLPTVNRNSVDYDLN